MSRSSKPVSQQSDQAGSFEDRLEMLFEELAFAVEWGRPSILLVPYESIYVRAEVELALEKHLAGIEQQIVHLTVDENQFDVPMLLSKHPERGHSIYFVSGLAWGGGKEGANAYRALNIRRELFVDYPTRVIFWLTGEEAVALSRHAPDFWAFRHRVVEFNLPSDLERLPLSADEMTGYDLDSPVRLEELDGQIDAREMSLGVLLENTTSIEIHLDLLYELAKLYQARREYARAAQRLKQAINLALPLNRDEVLARFWEQLGLVYWASKDYPKAIRAFRKAIRLIPENARFWVDLGRSYLAQCRADAARNAFRKAIKYSPSSSSAWTGLGQAYRLQSRVEAALHACRKATQLAPRDAGAWLGLGSLSIDLGLLPEARAACHNAVDLAPSNASSWIGFGRACQLEKRISDAIIAFQKAIALDPSSPAALLSLIACYRLIGKAGLAERQIKIAGPVMVNATEYDKGVFEAICGHTGEAVELLVIALQKGQAKLNKLQRDPNLDLVRDDPRFQEQLNSGLPVPD